MTPRSIVAAVATAAGLAALVARAVAVAMSDIERVLKDYRVEVPSVIPEWLQDEVDLP